MSMQPKSRKEKEVWQACDQLASENAAITYHAVGDRLIELGYRRGSNSDIHRYLSTWKKMKTKTKPLLSPLSLLSVEVENADPIAYAVEQFKKEIWHSANQEISILKTHLQEKIQALRVAEEKIHQLEKEILNLQNTKSAGNPEGLNHNLEHLITAVFEMSQHRDEDMIKLYNHHQAQFDRYLKAMTAARERNSRLASEMRYLRLEHENEVQKLKDHYQSYIRQLHTQLKIAEPTS